MTDDVFDIFTDTDDQWNPSEVTADSVDVRDIPAPSPDTLPAPDDAGDPARGTPQRFRLRVPDPLPVRNAPARIIRAQSLTVPSSQSSPASTPVLLGLDPSLVQSARIAGLLVTVTPWAGNYAAPRLFGGQFSAGFYAGDPGAIESSRALLTSDGLWLPGVAGIWYWPRAWEYAAGTDGALTRIQHTVSATVLGNL